MFSPRLDAVSFSTLLATEYKHHTFFPCTKRKANCVRSRIFCKEHRNLESTPKVLLVQFFPIAPIQMHKVLNECLDKAEMIPSLNSIGQNRRKFEVKQKGKKIGENDLFLWYSNFLLIFGDFLRV